jgi:hypothetical protein
MYLSKSDRQGKSKYNKALPNLMNNAYAAEVPDVFACTSPGLQKDSRSRLAAIFRSQTFFCFLSAA